MLNQLSKQTKRLLFTGFVLIFPIGRAYAGWLDQRIDSLFVDHPQIESAVLSNGVKVDLPVHYRQIAALVTMGTVNLEKVGALMKGTGLYPVPVTAKSGLALIYLVDHTDNSIGNYREFVTLIAATSNPERAKVSLGGKFHSYKKVLAAFFPSLLDREARKGRDFFFYVPFISVSTENALLAGREIWNLPKQQAEFQLSFDGSKKFAAMKGRDCGIEFEQGENHRPLEMPLYMDFSLVGFSNKDYSRITRAPMLARGEVHASFFDSDLGDRFKVDESTECGRWITEAGFKPQAWQFVPRSGALLFNQTTLNVSEMFDLDEPILRHVKSAEEFIQHLETMTE